MTRPKAMPYQRDGIRWLRKNNLRGLLADDVGLGKTMQALRAAKSKRKSRYRKRHPIVVVCPAIVKWNWEAEAKLHVNLRSQIIEGRATKRLGFMRHPLIIINYDILGDWKEELRRLKPWLVIIDEGHYIMNLDAQRTQHVFDLCRGIKHVIVLGATPLTSRPFQLFPVLHLLDKNRWPSKILFGHRYCQARKEYGQWTFKGAKKLPELHKKLSSTIMLRRMKADVLKDLPKVRSQVVELNLTNMKEYKDSEQNFIRWLMKTRSSRIKNKKTMQLAHTAKLLQLSAKLKMPAVIDWIDNHLAETDRKIFIVGWHKAIMKQLHDHYANSVLVNGSVTGRKRRLAIDRFRNDRDCKIFFGNISACGTGMNGLQFVCSDMALVEMTWVPADLVQVIGRLNRIGQENSIFVTHLIARGTIEARRCRHIQEKQQVINAVLDGRTEGLEDFSVFDPVLKELLKGKQ